MQITVTITGSKQLKSKLKRIGSGMHDLRAAFVQIGREAVQYFQTQGYLSQGEVFGQSWERLSRSYAFRKARRYPGRPPLVATGHMLSSYSFEAGANQVVIGNDAPQFKYHQSTKPRHKIPRRATMGINDPIKHMIQEAISSQMASTIRKA